MSSLPLPALLLMSASVAMIVARRVYYRGGGACNHPLNEGDPSAVGRAPHRKLKHADFGDRSLSISTIQYAGLH